MHSEEAELLGSAGGVQRMRHFFGNDPVLIVQWLFFHLSAVIQYHLSRAASGDDRAASCTLPIQLR